MQTTREDEGGVGDIIRLNKTVKITKAEGHARKGKLRSTSRPSWTNLPKIQRRKGAEVSKIQKERRKGQVQSVVAARTSCHRTTQNKASKRTMQNDAPKTKREKEKNQRNEKKGGKTHPPTHRPILRKYLIEPRYRYLENNSVHCGNTCT